MQTPGHWPIADYLSLLRERFQPLPRGRAQIVSSACRLCHHCHREPAQPSLQGDSQQGGVCDPVRYPIHSAKLDDEERLSTQNHKQDRVSYWTSGGIFNSAVLDKLPNGTVHVLDLRDRTSELCEQECFEAVPLANSLRQL